MPDSIPGLSGLAESNPAADPRATNALLQRIQGLPTGPQWYDYLGGREAMRGLVGLDPREQTAVDLQRLGVGRVPAAWVGSFTDTMGDPTMLTGAAMRGMQSPKFSRFMSGEGAMVGMPEDVAAATKAQAAGQPIRLYHGTGGVFEDYERTKMNPSSLYGRAIYMTENPEIASTYAENAMKNPDLIPKYKTSGRPIPKAVVPANVRMHYLDTRNPLDLDTPVSPEQFQFLRNFYSEAPSHQEALSQAMKTSPPPTWEQLRKKYHVGGTNLATIAKELGFDAMTHTGGTLRGAASGLPEHRVWIALDPNQVYHPWVTEGP